MAVKREEIIAKAMPGAIYHGEGWVTFALYAPQKQSVHLIGSFNEWDKKQDPLAQREPGYWVTSRHFDKGALQYQFVIDGSLVICDPYARQVVNVEGQEQPRAFIEPGAEPYHWQHDDWMRRSIRDLIIYEMHIGDFTEEGTFLAASEKLDHLAGLGISAIELMPVYEGAPVDYWGYQPTFLMAPRQAYGTTEDFCKLVDAAHAHDIAVILDMVLAHSGHQHPFNRMYPYEQSPWYGPGLGEKNQYGLPTFDYSKDPTYAFAKDVQACWLKKYHIDGFRYDYITAIGSDGNGKGLPGLMGLARAIQPDAFFIGECIPENPGLVNDSGLGAVWHMRSCQALQALLLETDVEPYSWSRFAEAVKSFDPTTQGYRDTAFVVNYAESHDEKRIMAGIREKGFDGVTAMKKSALAALVLMTIPGEPMLYQGQEWGEASGKSLAANKIHWSGQSGDGKQLLEAYRQACKLRRSRSSARSGNFAMPVVDEQKKCVVYHRQLGESDQAAIAVNFSGQKQTLSIPLPQPGKWKEYPDGKFFDAADHIDRQLDAYSAVVFLSG